MDNQTYILAIDQGTTSSRSVIVDKVGNIISSAQEEFEQIFPHPGWVEHDANKIWNNVQSVISGSLINGNIHPAQIEAIGITNQRETTVVWDKETGLPVYNAIVWQSRQTQAIADELIEAGHTQMVREKTGLQIDAYYSATKIRWILDKIENGQERAENGELLFGTIDTWLLYKLTDGGAHKTDYSNASRTMLFNIHSLEWDQELLELLNIPEIMLPEVKSNSEIYGNTTSYHFFGETIPIAGMCGDQQGALIGQLAFEKGMVKNTYGTGSFVIMNMGEEAPVSKNNLSTTIGYVIDGKVNYALEGSIFVTGSAIQWLRDGLEIIEKSDETEKMAYDSESDDEIYLVPAFTGLGAPHWKSDARGAVYGITRGTDKKDIIKATLQSIAYLSRDVFDAMEKDTGVEITELRVDGGASMNDYLMQFQADITDTAVRRPKNIETTVLGSAYLAGLAVGYWKDFDELKTLVGSGATFKPNMEDTKRKELYRGWENAVDATIYYSRKDS